MKLDDMKGSVLNLLRDGLIAGTADFPFPANVPSSVAQPRLPRHEIFFDSSTKDPFAGGMHMREMARDRLCAEMDSMANSDGNGLSMKTCRVSRFLGSGAVPPQDTGLHRSFPARARADATCHQTPNALRGTQARLKEPPDAY